MQVEIQNMVDHNNRYYNSLVENINSNSFSDEESSWMAEVKEEFDKKREEFKENMEFINEDLRAHVNKIYKDDDDFTPEEFQQEIEREEAEDGTDQKELDQHLIELVRQGKFDELLDNPEHAKRYKFLKLI